MKWIRFLSLFFLSGCSTYSNDFECPFGKGRACSSLKEMTQVLDTIPEEGGLPQEGLEIFLAQENRHVFLERD